MEIREYIDFERNRHSQSRGIWVPIKGIFYIVVLPLFLTFLVQLDVYPPSFMVDEGSTMTLGVILSFHIFLIFIIGWYMSRERSRHRLFMVLRILDTLIVESEIEPVREAVEKYRNKTISMSELERRLSSYIEKLEKEKPKKKGL